MQGKNQLRPTQISTLQNEPGLLSFFLFLFVEKNNALYYWQSIINCVHGKHVIFWHLEFFVQQLIYERSKNT